MRTDDYIVIQGWMLDLALTEKQLRLYAIIWGYSRDGRSRMRATAKHLADWCQCKERHAKDLVRQLEDMGLLAHEVVSTPKGRISEFWAMVPDGIEPVQAGAKTKIKWAGKRARKNRGDSAPECPTHSAPECPTPKGSNNTIPVSHTKSNSKISRDPARDAEADFIPPTVEEVAAYAKVQGFADPEGFADYYVRYQTEAEWMTGKGSKRKQISNWKLNVIQWSQYRKNQIFQEPEKARASEPVRKGRREISKEEFNSLFD